MSLLQLLRSERLESRRLLAVVWANEFVTDPLSPDYPRFNLYDDNEVFARAIVNQAISDWNEVITNFNYAEDADSDPNNDFDNTFTLRILAGQISNPTARGQTFQFDYLHTNSEGKPITASILLDDNAGDTGWFFDQTPEDDVEFTSLASPFFANFVDMDGQMTRLNDFYRTIAHEIGHALGINTNLSALQNMLSLNGHEDEVHREEGASDPTDLKTFVSTRANPQFGVQATFTGGHLYEGHPNDAPGVLVHPQELMNSGRTSPAGDNPAETGRAFISDLTVKILADA